jgi:dTDP-4-amino-4,6-dideoxygalactose transaminase
MKIFETQISNTDCDIIIDVLQRGELGFGNNTDVLENKFKEFSLKDYNISTNSASAAAFMLFAYMQETYGICDVYTTSLGFTSPVWAAKHFHHNIIFVDIDEHLNFSVDAYKEQRKHTTNQVIIMPVLYGGISEIPNFNIYGDEIVILDSAHCVTPRMLYDYAFFSFHPYKPICASDGGMISTNNKNAEQYFRSYKNFGRQNIGQTYTIEREGFKFYMNNLNATIALTQLDKYNNKLAIRKQNYAQLSTKYQLLPHDKYSSFYFATALLDDADLLIQAHNLSRHYPMLHKMPYYDSNQSLPILEKLHNKIINLPLWTTFPQ